MNILTIVVLAIMGLCAWSGFRKGLVNKLSGVVSMLLAAFLVSAALPYITAFIKNETPVYSLITQQCEQVLKHQIEDKIVQESTAQNGTIDRDKIKSLLNQYGMDSSQVDYLSDHELKNLVSQYFEDYMDQIMGNGQSTMLSLTRVEQTQLIQNLPIPDFLKNMIMNYNNSEGYRKLAVNSFTDYLVQFFANIILNIVAFVVTTLVVFLILRAVILAMRLFTRLPILSTINRLGGLGVGIIQGLFIVWILFMLMSMFSGTKIGLSVMDMVDQSTLIRPIYESNLFLKLIMQAVAGIM